MRKAVFMFALAVSFTSSASEVKQYWDRFYVEIKQCVLNEIKSQSDLKPAIKIETKNDLRNYLKSLDYDQGYYVLVDTSSLPSRDVCFLQYIVKQLGYTPVYFQPIEKVLIAVLNRKQDAVFLKEELQKKLQKPKVLIVEIP